MKKEGSYVGKVQNSGAQVIKAPLAPGKSKGGKVKEGTDLRVKGGKK